MDIESKDFIDNCRNVQMGLRCFRNAVESLKEHIPEISLSKDDAVVNLIFAVNRLEDANEHLSKTIHAVRGYQKPKDP